MQSEGRCLVWASAQALFIHLSLGMSLVISLSLLTLMLPSIVVLLTMLRGWLALQHEYDLKKHSLEPGSREEVSYLNRLLRCGAHGIEWESDPKHVRTLLRECGMEGCTQKQTPITKGGQGTPCEDSLKTLRERARNGEG